MKQILIVCCWWIALLLATPLTADEARFTTDGSKIIDPQGQEFVIQGVNLFPDRHEDFDKIVNCWGFNTIRVNHFPEADWHWYAPDWEFDLLKTTFADKRKVVILDLAHDSKMAHSGIGTYWRQWQTKKSSNYSTLEELYAYYAKRYKHSPYVWLELVNEPGTTTSMDSDAWVELHQRLILAIRKTGNMNPIVISGWCWGQDACDWGNYPVTPRKSAILGLFDKLMTINGEKQQNLIFTHHVYDQFQYNGPDKLADYHDAVIAKNLPLFVGEYGEMNRKPTMKATQYMFDSVQPRKIGRIVWKWDGKSPNDLTQQGGGRHIDSCESPTNLTELGKLVWHDLRTY